MAMSLATECEDLNLTSGTQVMRGDLALQAAF